MSFSRNWCWIGVGRGSIRPDKPLPKRLATE